MERSRSSLGNKHSLPIFPRPPRCRGRRRFTFRRRSRSTHWTGFYIGGNLGVGWQQGNLGDTLGNTFGTDNSIKGLGGGQVGVNYEFGNGVVVGAEAMFDWRFNNNNTSHDNARRPGGVSTARQRQ